MEGDERQRGGARLTWTGRPPSAAGAGGDSSWNHQRREGGHHRRGGGGGGGGNKRWKRDDGNGASRHQPRGVREDDEGHLWWDERTNVCTYFQDRRRKWPFYTDARGHVLLKSLVEANAALRNRNLALMRQLGDKMGVPADRIANEGERLYVNKPTLRGDDNVTWSFDEYGHPGLQLYYLKLKSWQRFTETYALLERADRLGAFAFASSLGRPVRIATLGGGPGYELLAMRCFLRDTKSLPDVDIYNTDVQPTWREYSEALGFGFRVFDIHNVTADLCDVCELGTDELDMVVISYVAIYFAKVPGNPQHEAACDMLFKLLKDRRVKMLVVSERSEETPLCSMMERRGCVAERLMDQDMGLDERQSIIVLKERRDEILTKRRLPPGEQRKLEANEATFKNVPFEEHKIKRGGAAGAGGSQTKWYD
mmetsp:Transcript_206/g.439  ORF Transcript_206/g.439 Transcript_206/m.439 type:complete len:424 (-) Transcript_206:71-1342(-)